MLLLLLLLHWRHLVMPHLALVSLKDDSDGNGNVLLWRDWGAGGYPWRIKQQLAAYFGDRCRHSERDKCMPNADVHANLHF
ncbi:hypothetical protein ACLKA6_003435 [Drosophila palustris]